MKILKILGTFDKKKDGTAFVSKAGKKYKKQSVVFAEYGDTIFSLPIFNDKVYKEGDDVRGEAGEIREYNGKKYGNWNFPKSKTKLMEEENAKLIAEIEALKNKK